MSAFPMEVVRRETCMSWPSMSPFGGRVVTRPSQEPVRVFNLSKDFCASDWAKATVESDIRTTDSRKRRDFMVSFSLAVISFLLSSQVYWPLSCDRSVLNGWAACHMLIYMTITLWHMSSFFCFLAG